MAKSVTATLVANTSTDMALGKNVGRLRITVVAGTTPIYFRTDGVAPTVAGADCQAIAGVPGAVLEVQEEGSALAVVKVISAGTPTVNVTEILP